MSTVASIPLSVYLKSVYEPDCEYVDGELKERNLGEIDHARMQILLAALLFAREADWKIRVYPELRVQVAPTRFRVPDVLVTTDTAPDEQILTHPPLIAIEILSPEDTFNGMHQKLEDYLRFGIPNIWIVDIERSAGYVCRSPNFSEWQRVQTLTVPNTPITVELEPLFRKLKA